MSLSNKFFCWAGFFVPIFFGGVDRQYIFKIKSYINFAN